MTIRRFARFRAGRRRQGTTEQSQRLGGRSASPDFELGSDADVSQRNEPYKKILLKLSGEALAGKEGYGIDTDVLNLLAAEIKEIHDAGVEISLVIGGGNIFRGHQGRHQGDGSRFCRLHGNARHDAQLPGAPGRARAHRRPHPRAVRHRDAGARRALHPPPRRSGTSRRTAS